MQLGEMGYKYGQWQQDYGERKAGYYKALPFAIADVGAKFAMGYGQMKSDYRTAGRLEQLGERYQTSQESMAESLRQLLKKYSYGG